MPRLVELEIEAFRGVGKALTFDLDAEAILLRGDNGLGKTTVVDAVSWLLCGELPQLSERLKGLRKGDDPIVNRYSEGPARARLAIREGDNVWSFQRRGTNASSALDGSRNGALVDDPAHALAQIFGHQDHAAFSNAVQTWGILRQDAVRAALDAGAALHERLARVIGLERVTRFAESATRVAKELTRERSRVRAELAAAQQADSQIRETVRELREATSELSQQNIFATLQRQRGELPDGIDLDVSKLTDAAALTDVGREVGSLVDAAQRILSARVTLEGLTEDQQANLAQASSALAEAQRQLNEITQRSPLMVQLATSALQLLGPTCPVCQQPIDLNSVRRHLDELLQNSEEDRRGEAQARDAVHQAQQQVAATEQSTARLRAAQAEAHDAAASLGRLVLTDGLLQLSGFWLDPGHASELMDAMTQLRDGLRIAFSQLPEAAQARHASAEVAADATASEVVRLRLELKDLDARCQRAATLDKAAHAAARRIVDAALARIGPSFAEVFDRLAPHPTFTVLRARQDIYYGKNQIVPEVYDPERNVAANPLAVYSEGQLNVVALSYFLGLALNARDGALPFMFLDDPLQAMDVLSVLGFSDLCRRIREQRQLIVTTHDRRFADVLLRKLAPRDPDTRTLVIEFSAWTREGPEVAESSVQPSIIEPLLREA